MRCFQTAHNAYINKKNKNVYYKLYELENKTNDKVMVLYKDSKNRMYVRYKDDFLAKFEKVDIHIMPNMRVTK